MAVVESAGAPSPALFAPRRAGPPDALPPNTKLTSVLGAQPPSFKRGREVAALVLWTFAVFYALALGSYKGDPSVPLSADVQTIVGENWVGPVGAHVARAIVTLVGIAAWVVPIEAILLGIPFVRGRRSNATPARVAGDILMVVIAAALVQVGWPGEVAFGRHAGGGLVGELFGELARSLFSSVGSFLVGFALLGLILIGRASFSFIALVREIERLGRVLAAKLAATAGRIADAWRRARGLERARAEEKRLEEEPAISVAAKGQATILAGIGDDAGEAGDGALDAAPDSEREAPPAPVRVRLPTPAEPFPEHSPLVALGDGAAPSIVVVEQEEKKPRRRRSDGAAGPPGAPGAAGGGNGVAAEAAADAKDEADESAPKRSRKRAVSAKADVAADEAIAEASGLSDDVAGAARPARGADPLELPVTPLEGIDVAPKTKKPRPPAKKPADIMIVDTSAALDKEAPATADDARGKPKDGGKDKRAGAREAPAFKLPALDMLVPAEANIGPIFDEAKLRANAELLVKTLSDYKVTGKVEEILPGPVVTTYEVSPVAGTKVSKVAALADDLALALAKKVRIVAPIPGKNRIGFELPNDKRVAVNLRDLVEDRRFQTLDVPLPVVLGRDIVGNPVYADLASMPHAIVAGATGAGKSVGLNVMLTSLLFRRTPEELRMLMIDPKVVELAPYDRIPHMLLPVVTDMKQAATALKWAVDEMERRYQLFADAGTKNIGTYNAWVKRVVKGEVKNPLGKAIVGKDLNGIQEVLRVRDDDPDGEQQMPETLPMIVIVVDEFADLMMQQGKEVEAAVARLAQKARAAGMHVILATQRPSVDVITGMIKANFPTRIAYRVAQKIDSRTILDEQGAEHLLGRGDMLIKLNGTNETRRVQCPWVSEEEVQAVTDHLRAQGEPIYDDNILKPRDEDAAAQDEDDGEQDPMYDDAVRIVADTRRCSTSWLQRKLGLGYNRAARIVETMERRGLVGPANGAKDREVLIDAI
jgi:S-DNA-T family DNA segregation ATPase FtsK/SpoIIIE